MTAEQTGASCCDECGRAMAQATRIRKGRRYCGTCYGRIFKRRLCPKCGNFARLPINDPNAACRRCETAKPCIRCGKVDYEIGKITPYGPVCNACSLYFRAPKPCGLCGVLSRQLTRITRLGLDIQVCPKCARADHGTCMMCRRHRLLIETDEGMQLCKACAEYGEVPCPKCGKSMPAGYGKACSSCYWRELFEKRIKMDCAAFSRPVMAGHFRDFGLWLGKRVGDHKGALTIHRYLPFFMEMEQKWQGIPDYATMTDHFGVAGLRRVLLPVKWLEERELIIVDEKAKSEDPEKRRIAALIASLPEGSEVRGLLTSYYQRLEASRESGKTSLRSVRLALSPAVSLLQEAINAGGTLPDLKILNSWITIRPGQRSAVTGFLNHLKQERSLDLLAGLDTRKVAAGKKRRLETKLMKLLRQPERNEKEQSELLIAALEYFHGVPRKKAMHAKPDKEIDLNSKRGFFVSIGSQQFWLPELKVR